MFFEEKRAREREKTIHTKRYTRTHRWERERRWEDRNAASCVESIHTKTNEKEKRRKTRRRKCRVQFIVSRRGNRLWAFEKIGWDFHRSTSIVTMTVQEKSIERTTRTHAKTSLLVCLARYHRISHGCDETAAAPSFLTGSCWLLMNMHGWCL